MVAGK